MKDEEYEACESAIAYGEGTDPTVHECWEPKDHSGPHICVACSEQW